MKKIFQSRLHQPEKNIEGNCYAAVIAKSFGGGGHKGASGFRIKDINSIINN